MKKKYKSKITAAMHEMMSGFHEAGVIPDSTMQEFDRSCLIEESDILAAVHEATSDLHAIGLLDEKTTQGFDEKGLMPDEIKAIADTRHIIGAFGSPEDAALMDEVMELVMRERQRRSDEWTAKN